MIQEYETIYCYDCDGCKYEDVEKLREQNKQLLDALKDKQKAISNVHCTNCTDKNINDFCIHCIYNFKKITGKKPEEHNV